jgi:hypothetical protein
MPARFVASLKPLALTPDRIRLARVIAVAADLVQLAIVPAFAGGFVAPVNDALDVVVAAALIWILGWHWVFLPTFLSELIPFWDLVPNWTAAVLFVTRQGPPPRDITASAPPRG